MKNLAIFWDFDGTIVNTDQKNFQINQEIYSILCPNITSENLPVALHSLENFSTAYSKSVNWRDLYMQHFGYSKLQTDEAGKLWSQLQPQSDVPITVIEGVAEVIHDFAEYSQAICSQNCVNNIEQILAQYNLTSYFTTIMGHNSLDSNCQKPHPAGFLRCVDEVDLACDGTIIYIGDHEQDTQFAKNAKRALGDTGSNINVISIAACYEINHYDKWDISPDHFAYSVKDLPEVINRYID